MRIGEGDSFTAVDTITIPSTGGWQNWLTISSTAYLPEGRYTLRNYVRVGEFNTNWLQATKETTTGLAIQKLSELLIYPNPASDFVNIDLTNKELFSSPYFFLSQNLEFPFCLVF